MVKPGQMVIIHKPRNVDESPTWVEGMDKYNGMTGIVDEVWSNYSIYIVGISLFKFNAKWLEVVEDDDIEPIEFDGIDSLIL